MTIHDIVSHLETIAPLSYQESYDNSGLITGSGSWPCTGILICLDATEEVVKEAIKGECNLIVAHHPIIFKGLTQIIGKNYIERAVITAIKNDIAVYAIHTNLDNVKNGVSGEMAERLGLINCTVLLNKTGTLKKIFTFVPQDKVEQLRHAIFTAGAGQISNYSECSFAVEGMGTFKAGKGAHPYVGKEGERHYEKELKIEVIFPSFMENSLVKAMIEAHPYEQVAYDVVELANSHPGLGSGVIGDLREPMTEIALLRLLKQHFSLKVVRHTALSDKPVNKVALCGGAGGFLISTALARGADFFITADLKYHEFFDGNGRMVIADIGHYESEQFTIDLVYEILKRKFHNFAILKTAKNTNPVNYFMD